MSLDDPFGRVSRKREVEYADYRKALQQAGIDSPAAVHRQLGVIWKHSDGYAGALTVGALLGGFLFPGAAGLLATLLVLFWLWLAATALRGHRYTRRYLEELESARGGGPEA